MLVNVKGGLQHGRKPVIRRARIGLLIFVILIFAVLIRSDHARAQEHAAHPHWSYNGPGGPAHWGDLEPDFTACKNGTRQSPIDIRNPRRSELPPIQFEYKPVPLTIIDNGHTIQINVKSGGEIKIGAERYSLVQFHFHRPSEEEIDGKQFDFVAHLVHRDAAGHLAVVAVLFRSGTENPFIRTLWTNWPPDKGHEYSPKNVIVNVTDLLPNGQIYYSFPGSLTTPPCTEGVKWYVLKSPVEISAAQIGAFAKLYPNNARPVQPTNGREILETSFSNQ